MNYKKIKDICVIKKGKKVLELEEQFDDSVRYIQIGDLRDNRNLKYCSPDLDYVYVNNDDLIITWDGANAGTIGFNLEGAIGSTLAKISVLDKAIFAPFLALYLQSKFDYFQRTATGATIPHISRTALENLEVPMFSVEQQKFIFNQLIKTKKIIEKRQSQITALDELTQSLFLDMFGDPLKNTKELPMKQLGSLLEVKGGYAFKSKDFIDEGVPVIKIGTANKGYFDEKTLAFLPNDYKGKYEDYLVSTGDLLITLTGTVGKDDYGNICRVDGSFNNYLLNQRVAKFEIKSDLTKSYLYHCFKNKSYKEQLTKASRGVRQANISNNDIKKLIIPIPPMEDQIKFEEIILKIDDSKIGFLKSLEEVNNLYNSLLKSAFKGELFQE